MNVVPECRGYLAAGVQVVHVSIYNGLEHHLGMVGASASFLVELLEIVQFKVVYHAVNQAYRVVSRNIFIYPLRKKAIFVWDCNPESATLYIYN